MMGWTAFAASIAGIWLGPEVSGALSAACAAAGLLAALWFLAGSLGRARAVPAKRAGIAACPFLAAALVFAHICGSWYAHAAPVQCLDGQKAYARLQVMNYPEKSYGRYRYRVKVTHLDYTQVDPFFLLLTTNAPLAAQPYELTECEVNFYKPDAGGLYSQQNRLLAEGCVLRGSTYGSSLRIRNSVWSPGRLVEELRRMAGQSFSRYLPPGEAGLIRRVLLGQSDGLSDIASSCFSKIGCSHMLAVSGLHLTIVAGLISLMCRRLAMNRREKNLIRALLLLGYMCMTGFPVGVLRSGMMFMLYLAMDSLYSSVRSQDSLGVAVLLICLFRPFSGGDLGFALSALSTWGIITLYKPLFARLTQGRNGVARRMLRPFISVLCVTLSAMLFTLPVLLLSFEGLSLVSPLANFLLLPVLTALLYCSAFLGFTAFLSKWWAPFAALSQPLAFCAGWLARIFLSAARWLARLPGVFFHIDQGIWMPALCAAVFLILLIRHFRALAQKPARGLPLKRLAAGGLALVLLGTQIRWELNRDWVTLAVAGSRESPCVILMKNGQAAALSLGGYHSAAAEVLEKNHILSLKGIFLPSAGPEALDMAVNLGSFYSVGALMLPEGAYVSKELQELGPAKFVAPGSSFSALPGIEATLSEDGRRLSFPIHGIPVILELEASGTGSCGLLISCSPETEIQGEWTVLLEEEGPELSLRVSPKGEIYLRKI